MNDMTLILEFVQEAREYIDEIEPTLIELNQGSDQLGAVNPELINAVFRLFHSMKGSAGFLALTTLVGVTHEAETLLDKIRQGKQPLTLPITDTLCRALDLFREMLDHIADSGNDHGFDVPAKELIETLKVHTAGKGKVVSPPTPPTPAQPAAPTPPPAPVPSPAPVPPVVEKKETTYSSIPGVPDEFLATLPAQCKISPEDLAMFYAAAMAEAAENAAESAEKTENTETSVPVATPPAEQHPTPVPTPSPAGEHGETAKAMDEEVATLQLAPEMRAGFVQEATEQIDAAEQALLLVLDETQDSTEPIKDSFRYIHSFKGNCGFMGIQDLEHLSHTMETLLDALRNGEIAPGEKNVGKLLSLLDVLRGGVQSIETGGAGRIKDLNYHLRALNSLMGNSVVDVAAIGGHTTSPAPVAAQAAASVVKETPTAVVATAAAATTAAVMSAGMEPPAMRFPGSGGGAGSTSGGHWTGSGPSGGSDKGGGTASAGGGTSSAAAKGKQDIRVDLGKLDALINLVGELVIAESMVTRCEAVAHVEDEYYNRAKHQLRRICDEIKDVAMSVRMIPLSTTFRKMIRLVHDLATKSGKKIKLNLIGEETEVDKTVIEQIADPLVHIVRNSCDHGVETPDERFKAGKTDTGTVNLEGRHEGGEVWILISDDGRGLNREKIISKALEKGLIGPDAREWPDDKIFRLVFEPGFSTADKITDISGRGVGMDVVKRNIEKLNGRIDIQSRGGRGSTFILRIPLTLAIVDAMLVRVGTGKYMIPTLSIRESLVPLENQVTVTPNGKEILRIREEMIPIIRLYDVFGQEPSSIRLKDGVLMVGEDGGRSFAFFVDEIIGQQQTVIKGLPDYIGKSAGFSGCTILGDGAVSLILDVGAVSQMRGTFAASPTDKSLYWDVPKDTTYHGPVGGLSGTGFGTDTADDSTGSGNAAISFDDLEAKVSELQSSVS